MINIKILGMGCGNCNQLESNIKKAIKELNLEVEIEKITDIKEIMSYNVMSLPAFVINNKVELFGKIAGADEIKLILKKYL